MALPQTTRLSLALLAVFALLSLAAQMPDVTEAEGRVLWAVADNPVDISGLAQTLQHIRASLTGAWSRAGESGLSPLYLLPLDAWTLLAGRSLFSLRLFHVLLALALLALAYRLTRRWAGQRAAWGVMGVGTAAACVLLGAFLARPPAWAEAVRSFNQQRGPLEPALTLIAPDSPLRVYFAELQQGITLDLGWRTVTPEEIQRAARALHPAPLIWAWLPLAQENDLLALLQGEGYAVNLRASVSDNMAFYRLVRGE